MPEILPIICLLLCVLLTTITLDKIWLSSKFHLAYVDTENSVFVKITNLPPTVAMGNYDEHLSMVGNQFEMLDLYM